MAPFRNKGFPYFEKMLDIMPNTSARGGHAFLAIHAAPPAQLNPTVNSNAPDEDKMSGVETATNLTTVSEDNNTSTDPTFALESTGKHKLSAITHDAEMVDIPSITPSKSSLEPTNKKITNPSISMTLSSRSIPKSTTDSSAPSFPSKIKAIHSKDKY